MKTLNKPSDEPCIGSIVLVNGPSGTAWQRFSDGNWHKAGFPKTVEFRYLLENSSMPVLLIHEPIESERNFLVTIGIKRTLPDDLTQEVAAQWIKHEVQSAFNNVVEYVTVEEV